MRMTTADLESTPKSKAQLVLVTMSEDGSAMTLKQFVGKEKKLEAQMEIHDELTPEGVKEVIEEFRVSK